MPPTSFVYSFYNLLKPDSPMTQSLYVRFFSSLYGLGFTNVLCTNVQMCSTFWRYGSDSSSQSVQSKLHFAFFISFSLLYICNDDEFCKARLWIVTDWIAFWLPRHHWDTWSDSKPVVFNWFSLASPIEGPIRTPCPLVWAQDISAIFPCYHQVSLIESIWAGGTVKTNLDWTIFPEERH